MRRLRRTATLRNLVAEVTLSVDDLVAPLFVREGIDSPQPVASLPGVVQHTVESLVKEVNYRVKGTEMFWNDPEGAEAILQVSGQAGPVQVPGAKRAMAHSAHGFAQQGNVAVVLEAV